MDISLQSFQYPFSGNGFITGTITSNYYEVFLPFPAAANYEDSTQFSSDYCVLLQQIAASEFASFIAILHGPKGKHSLYC
jgi:membrane-bound acyltransferase YfiQ involved in biofilm formation